MTYIVILVILMSVLYIVILVILMSVLYIVIIVILMSVNLLSGILLRVILMNVVAPIEMSFLVHTVKHL